MANFANSMSQMSETFAEIRPTPSATARRDSRAVDSTVMSSRKRRKKDRGNEDTDVETLIESPSEDTCTSGLC